MTDIRNEIRVDPLLGEGYTPGRVETASFAMGCFWGPDGLFGGLPGVIRTRVGYAGGTAKSPSYHRIGDHAETIQIDFDPTIIRYKQLLERFWTSHDAYARPYSTQYRSLVLLHDDAQRAAAEALIDREAEQRGTRPLTEVVPIGGFTRAERYHQKYRLQTTSDLREVVAELSTGPGGFDAFVDSTVAARLNGYVAGWVARERLEREIDRFGLSEDARATVLAFIR